jgi:hypothetical protein
LERERFLEMRSVVRRGAGSTDHAWVGGLWASRVEDVNAPTPAQKEYLIRPGLERLRGDDLDKDVQSEILIALGRISVHAEESSEVLREYLRAPSQDLAQSAILGLGLLGDEVAWNALHALLVDDAQGRWLADAPAGVSQPLRSWAALATGLGASKWSEEVRAEAIQTLSALANESSSDPELQASLIVAWGTALNQADLASHNALMALMNDGSVNQSVRALVPAALARAAHGDDGLAESTRVELLRILQSDTPATVRQGAIRALALLPESLEEHESKVIATLSALAKDARTPAESHYALLSLAELAVQSEDVAQIEATASLLTAQLEAKTPERAAWAAVALGVLGAEQPLWAGIAKVRSERALLSQLVEGRDEELRGACAISLGLIGQANAAQSLRRIVEAGDHPSLAGHAAVALGLLGDQEALPLLTAQLERSAHRPTLLEQTAVGLALLNAEELHGQLLRMLAPRDGALPTLAEVTAASRGLAMIGNARTAPFLLTALDNDNLTPNSRALATRALGYVADADPTPWQLRLLPGLNLTALPSSVLDWEGGAGLLNRR